MGKDSKSLEAVHEVWNEEVETRLAEGIRILDVREPLEYEEGHIPGAVLIPLGDLEDKLTQLNKEEELYVVCRSGRRSEVACYILMDNGFRQVHNVVPGMIQWTGPIERK